MTTQFFLMLFGHGFYNSLTHFVYILISSLYLATHTLKFLPSLTCCQSLHFITFIPYFIPFLPILLSCTSIASRIVSSYLNPFFSNTYNSVSIYTQTVHPAENFRFDYIPVHLQCCAGSRNQPGYAHSYAVPQSY